MTKFPDMSNIVASAGQHNCRNLFKEAVAYAKTVIADPVLKMEWQKRLRRRNGVYNEAIKVYMNSKKITRQTIVSTGNSLSIAFKNTGDINDSIKLLPEYINSTALSNYSSPPLYYG